MKLKLVMLVAVVVCGGCGVTEGGKQLNYQNKGAGEVLAGHPDAAVAAIGADVRDNSAALEAEIGTPKEAKAYSAEASAAARDRQQADLAARRAWLDFADWAVGAVAALAGLGGVWAWVKKLNLSKVVKIVIGGIESLPPDIAPKVKEAVLTGSLRGGVSDLLHGIVKKVTP